MKVITFEVKGAPRPAGSKNAFLHASTGKIIVTDSSGVKGKKWRQEVAQAAREAMDGAKPLAGPVSVYMTFYRQRPKSHYGTGRNANVLKNSAQPHPLGRPDCLKLARGVEDSMTGIVYEDDAQIIDGSQAKLWGEEGVYVKVMELSG